MRRFVGHAAVLAFVIVNCGAALAQSEAQFVQACQAGGKRSVAACTCQAKLARKSLNAREQRAALAAMRGDDQGMAREVKAMGKKGVQTFDAKMGRLSAQSRKAC